jgi:hypothetical protein
MIDLDLGRRFMPANNLIIRPKIGLQSARINQTFNTQFQGYKSVRENISKDFTGIGPKAGIHAEILLQAQAQHNLSLIADFSMTFLAGKWQINDIFDVYNHGQIIIDVANRRFGALNVHSSMGARAVVDQFSIKLLYELNDFFNQCQIFDDATGPHNNNLILQGITAQVSWQLDR